VQMCTRVSKDDLLFSHARQLAEKELVSTSTREEETAQHLETLQRLRSEMVLDYSQREQRKELTKLLAGHQRVQQDEKSRRDAADKGVVGMDHWPFRTEEQVQQAITSTNRAQKASLDKQLAEKREKLEYLQKEAARRQQHEQQQALAELKALETEKKGGRALAPKTGVPPQSHSVEKALESAFSRYEDYLHTRKEGLELSSSFQREQRYLSEQAELLKTEEQRRRMAEMRSYLERQMKDKEAERASAKVEASVPSPVRGSVSSLPTGSSIDAEEEAYVKMALKHALDGQVQRKEEVKTRERATEVQQEQQALSHVAREMQEARFRSWSERKQQEEALKATWAKQQQLRLMEATLDKAEAA